MVVSLLFVSALAVLAVAVPAAHAASSLALDGSASNYAASGGAPTSVSVSLTTSSANDVIYVCAGDSFGEGTPTISDGSSLTWNSRLAKNSGPFTWSFDCWYAVASGALSSDSITASGFPNAGLVGSDLTIIAFGISGANTASPFDPGVTSPSFNSLSSTTSPSTTISTTDSNDFIIGEEMTSGNAVSVSASGSFTITATPSDNTAGSEYEVVSSAQTNLAVGFTVGASVPTYIMADAIVGAQPSSASVSCSPSSIAVGSPSTCTATVTGSSPTGTVTWSQTAGSGSATFSSSTCSLSSGSCSVTATGAAEGSVTVKGAYGGDSANAASSGTFSLTVGSPGFRLPPIPSGDAPPVLSIPTYGNATFTGHRVGMIGGAMVEYNVPGWNSTLFTQELFAGNQAAWDLFPLPITSCIDGNGNVRTSGFFMSWFGGSLNSTEVIFGDYQSFVSSSVGWPPLASCGA